MMSKSSILKQKIQTIEADLTATLYSPTPFVLLSVLVNSTILSTVLWDFIVHSTIVTWFVLTNSFSLIRLIVYIKFKSLPQKQQTPVFFSRFILISSIVSGCSWGAVSIWLFPPDQLTQQTFIAFVIAGMCTGAVTTLSANTRAVGSFLILALSPLLVQLTLSSLAISHAMATMVVLFITMMFGIAKRLNQTITESFSIRHEHLLTEQALINSEKRYRTLFNQSADAYLILQDNQFIDCNPTAVKMSNYHTAEKLLATLSAGVLKEKQGNSPVKLLLTQQNKERAIKHGHTRYELDYMQLNGEVLALEVLLNHIPDEKHEIIQVVCKDISDRKAVEEYHYFRSHILEKLTVDEPLQFILQSIVTGIEKLNPPLLCSILLLDDEGKHLINPVSPSLPSFYNKAIDGLEIGPQAGSCGTAAYTRQQVIVENIMNDPRWEGYRHLAKQAGIAACWSEPIFSSDNKDVLGTFAIYHQEPSKPSDKVINLIQQTAHLTSIAIERKQMEQQLRQFASIDSLTGLANRRTLDALLEHAINLAARTNQKGALLFIDLNKFKNINDSLGHKTGDELLKQVANRLTNCLRDCDTVARFGGDEFIVLLDNLSSDIMHAAFQAEAVVKKILELSQEPYTLANIPYRITLSIGVAIFDGQEASETLLQQADIAMYQAKQSGEPASFFSPQMQQAITEKTTYERELSTAIAEQQLQLFYQPQMNAYGRCIGAEALLRWQHPQRGLVPPATFIPIAEETGLIIPIGLWALTTACQQLKAWEAKAQTQQLVLAVNISAEQFSQANFATQVLNVIDEYSINPNRLKLELTESILANNIDEIIITMHLLQEVGVQFSLDDFGTGYSSLQYLRRLPLNQLKIDQAFVRDLANNRQDKTIVKTIIAMASTLDLDVIAEGVETTAQKDILLKTGCHHFQGYLFAKPMPIKQFNRMLENQIENFLPA